ncbi:MAG: ribonuclease III [Anaerolineae bacterium SM23_ 63]|nr:MAG: ribonuclease III [Anaerolineae bacterium SM23_ 63]HEY47024.1 ribonuclease III [Anaerolineae bacterium]
MRSDVFAQKAGLQFADVGLLQRALTHRSYVNEHPEILEDNERLEFLGDAVLDFLTGAWLYNRFPEMDEGQLTRLRSALVRTEQLAAFAHDIHMGQVLLLGRGEEATGGRERQALLCGAFEALIGAIYLDSGLDRVMEFMEPRLEIAAEAVLEDESLFDARSLLQIWAQANIGETPRYRTVSSHGPDHEREFVVEVSLQGKPLGEGQGHSKQEAAQNAASVALSQIEGQKLWFDI